MSNLLSTHPLDEFERMNRLFDRVFGAAARPTTALRRETGMALPVDVYEKEDVLYVRAAVPGIRPEELEVSIEENVLTIRGENRRHDKMTESKVYLAEYAYGSFTRSIRLPEGLDLEKVDAEFDHGFVTISIPRQTPAKPAAIKVHVRNSGQVLEVNPQPETTSN